VIWRSASPVGIVKSNAVFFTFYSSSEETCLFVPMKNSGHARKTKEVEGIESLELWHSFYRNEK
jgi:hypothetical protein